MLPADRRSCRRWPNSRGGYARHSSRAGATSRSPSHRPSAEGSAATSSVDKDVVEVLGLADARRRGTATDELVLGWPERHVLVAGGVVVPDECDLIYVDGEQVEAAGLRMPSEVAAHRGGVPPLGLDVIDAARDSADLELALSAFAVGYRGMNQHARIPRQVLRFARPPQHREPQPPVAPDRHHEYDAGLQQAPAPQFRQAWLTSFDLGPVHHTLPSMRPFYHRAPTRAARRTPTRSQQTPLTGSARLKLSK